jgi:hypothetical protein
LYFSQNIIRTINSKGMRWAGYVARMGEMRNYTNFYSETEKARSHLGDVGEHGRVLY